MDHHYLALYTTYALSHLDKKINTEKKSLFRTGNSKCEKIPFLALPISRRASGLKPYQGAPRMLCGTQNGVWDVTIFRKHKEEEKITETRTEEKQNVQKAEK
jgi:hypothetical protein